MPISTDSAGLMDEHCFLSRQDVNSHNAVKTE